jgi:hypothetical protein
MKAKVMYCYKMKLDQKGRDCKCNQAFMGFGVNDHQLRGLMRFIEIMSRESNIENDEQVAGIQKCEVS